MFPKPLISKMSAQSSRRSFGKSVLTAAAGSIFLKAAAAQPGEERGISSWEPGIKISHRLGPDLTEEDLAFFSKLGVRYATIWTTIENASLDYFRSVQEKTEPWGVKIWNIGILDLHCDPTIVLGLPGVDEKIRQYKVYLENLGQAGIPYTTYAHMANIKIPRYYMTGQAYVRGDIPSREFDMAVAGNAPLSHGRRYSEEEIWETFRYFVQSVMPTAERAGVRIGLHPDDPPVPSLGGIARIFRNFRGLERALETANSKNFGICLCVGTWAEGGNGTEKNVYETLRSLGLQRHLFKVHMRNVDSPLPKFKETFVDEGYIDMPVVMRILLEVGFNGIVIPDHVPGEGNRGENTAYTLGYMNALRDMVQTNPAVR